MRSCRTHLRHNQVEEESDVLEHMAIPSSFVLQEYKSKEFKSIKGRKGELGTGGFGTVRLSFHRVLGPVALKCFPVTGGDHEKSVIAKEIRNELETLQKSNHAHILRVHGWTQWSGSMALVLEFLPGGNLNNFLRDPQTRLRTILRLRISSEVADAISFIHNLTKEKRLTHGDIKPDNVLLTDDLHCKLGDFGGAKLSSYTGKLDKPDSTESEKDELTPIYAAPERLTDEPVKPKKEQDTYSYALIVHMVLTGEAPYQHYASVSKYLQAITRGKRPSTESIEELKQSMKVAQKREIIEVLEGVMKRCWDHTPSRRPNMLDVRDELQLLLRKCSNADVLQSVTDAVAKMDITVPVPTDHSLVSLHLFDTKTRTFLPDDSKDEIAAPLREPKKEEKKVKLSLSDIFSNPDLTVLPVAARKAFDLLQQYKVALRGGNFSDANTVTAQFISFVEAQVQTTTEELRLFAIKLRSNKRFLESIAMFDAAAFLCRKKSNPKECVSWMAACMDGMKETAIAMLKVDVGLKAVIRGHVISRMRDVQRQIEDLPQVKDHTRCLQVTWVLQSVEFCEYLADQWEAREATLTDALARMKRTFGSIAQQHSIYGTLLHNLGNVYKRSLRLEKAASQYIQAIETFNSATDYEDEGERKEDLKRSEANLQAVYQKMADA